MYRMVEEFRSLKDAAGATVDADDVVGVDLSCRF